MDLFKASFLAGSPVSMLRRVIPPQVLLLFVLQFSEKKESVYNLLWVLVFAFATLNILGLIARQIEPQRRGMSFGELVAVCVVAISVILLASEMIALFRVFPIKLGPH